MRRFTSILGSCGAWLSATLITLCVHATVLAQTEIHRCVDADGGAVYSQLPCAPEEPANAETSEQEELTAAAETDAFIYEVAPDEEPEQEPKTEEEVAACKKRYRDAIDVIDAEIARDFSADQADSYKQRLLELTQQLRRC